MVVERHIRISDAALVFLLTLNPIWLFLTIRLGGSPWSGEPYPRPEPPSVDDRPFWNALISTSAGSVDTTAAFQVQDLIVR